MPDAVLSCQNVVMDVPAPLRASFESVAVTRERCPARQKYGPQQLGGLAVFLTQSGQATLIANGQEIRHQPHRVVVVAQGTWIHEFTGESDWHIHYIIGRGSWSEACRRWLGDSSSQVFDHHLRLEAAYNSFTDHLFKENQGANSPNSGWDQAAHLCHLMHELESAFALTALPDWLAQLESAVENTVYLHSVEDLATLTGLSMRTLRHQFLKLLDLTPSQWLRQKRLQRAQSWLRQGYSVTEVGEKLGFSSPFAFSRAFKQSFGVAPSCYRSSAPLLHIARETKTVLKNL